MCKAATREPSLLPRNSPLFGQTTHVSSHGNSSLRRKIPPLLFLPISHSTIIYSHTQTLPPETY
jgi:hypothetical protein